MDRAVRLLTLALTAALLAAPARGENFALPHFSSGDLGAGFHLGLALPLGSEGLSSRAGRAPSFSLRATKWLGSWTALGGELGTEVFLKHSSPSVPGGTKADASYSATALFLALLGRVNLLEDSSWSPYLVGGAGFSKLSAKASAPTPVCWPLGGCGTGLSGSSTGPYLTGGFGVEFFGMRGMAFSLEGRWRQYRTDRKSLTGNAESLSTTFGTTFVF